MGLNRPNSMYRPCPFSGMGVNLDNARDTGRHFLRIDCPYCGKDVAVNNSVSTVRRHLADEQGIQARVAEAQRQRGHTDGEE